MEQPHPLIHRTLDRFRVGEAKLDPISLLVVTNHPEVYAPDEDAPNTRQLLSIIPTRPLKPMANQTALQYIHQAAQISSRVPQQFPVDDRQSANRQHTSRAEADRPDKRI